MSEPRRPWTPRCAFPKGRLTLTIVAGGSLIVPTRQLVTLTVAAVNVHLTPAPRSFAPVFGIWISFAACESISEPAAPVSSANVNACPLICTGTSASTWPLNLITRSVTIVLPFAALSAAEPPQPAAASAAAASATAAAVVLRAIVPSSGGGVESCPARVEEELDGAAGAADRREHRPADEPAGRPGARGRALERGAELVRPARRTGERELELRLHQRDQVRMCVEVDPVELRKRVGEREVGEVDGDEVDRLRHEPARQLAEVRALEVHDARIGAQRAEELAVTRVDGVHAGRSPLEQDRGEAAGG